MDFRRKVVREIEPLDEINLENDLKFLYNNCSETMDQFLEEAVPIIKFHVSKVMEQYQDRMLHNLTNSLTGEIAGIMLRTRRETVYDKQKDPVNDW